MTKNIGKRLKEIKNRRCNIAVIGNLVWDRIIQFNSSRVEDFGGIAYNLSALGALANIEGKSGRMIRIFPVCNVGFDIFVDAKAFFGNFSAIDFSFIRNTPRKNIVHELRYDEKGYRSECNIGRTSKITPHLFQHCKVVDAVIVNYIGGDEFPPRYLRWLKDKYAPLIYLDYHSLALGRTVTSRKIYKVKRHFRYNPHWRKYIELADIVQMNYDELKSIFSETVNETGSIVQSAKNIYDAGPDIVIITREDKELVLIAGPKYSPKIYIMPVHPVGKLVDSTGCGDSFAAGFVISYYKDRDVVKACEHGLSLACQKAGFSGLTGFLKLIK